MSDKNRLEEIKDEFRSIISHAFLGCDTSDISRETWELTLDGVTKYALELKALEESSSDVEKMGQEEKKGDWELTGHSYQIADTGDYDGNYEITNGKISLLTKDDDEEALQPIVNALNNSGAKFYMDDAAEFEAKMYKELYEGLQKQIEELLNQQKKNCLAAYKKENEYTNSDFVMAAILDAPYPIAFNKQFN